MKDWITKEEEKQIIETYQIYDNEIVPYGNGDERQYEVITVRRSGKGSLGLITIVPEYSPDHKYPRIFVRHSDAKGKRTFVDVWDRDSLGNLYWRFRNPSDVPISDRDYITEMEHLVSQLKGRNSILQKKCQNIVDTASTTKPAGRKPHPEKLDEQAQKVKVLIDEGLSEGEILERLGISRASFYRLKRRI